MLDETRITEIAAELDVARRDRAQVPLLTTRNPGMTVEDAYAIQGINIARRREAGATVIGRKVGLTSKPMQQMLGVSEPDYGILFDDMYVEEGDEVDLGRLIQPRIEAEIAFVLQDDLVGPGITAPRALAAVAGVLPALEIVDSRVVDWRIKLVDTVSDNASCGLLTVGARITPVAGLDLRLLGMALTRNGETIDSGAGAAALGNPARCVAWLANKFATFGESLHAGDIILPGAVHRMVPVAPGDVFRADFARLGPVTVAFSSSSSSSGEAAA